MKRTYIYLGVGVLIAFGAGFLFYTTVGKDTYIPFIRNTPTSATSTTSGGSGIGVTANGSSTVELVSIADIPVPSLLGEIKIASDIPEAVRAQIRSNIETLIATIKKDPTQLEPWIDLGNNRRVAKDYVGAAEAWEYVTKAAPNDYVAFNNLGDLNLSVLKNYPKAESYYKKAIAIRPDIGDMYRNLYMMYSYYYKTDTSAAKDILELGIKNNPGDGDLKGLLVEYNKAHAQ